MIFKNLFSKKMKKIKQMGKFSTGILVGIVLGLGGIAYGASDEWSIGDRWMWFLEGSDEKVYANVESPIDDSNVANKAYVDAAGGSTGDHLGNHTAEENITLGSYYLSGDGDDEGIFVDTEGRIGIGISNPTESLQINGRTKISTREDINDAGILLESNIGDDSSSLWAMYHHGYTEDLRFWNEDVEGEKNMLVLKNNGNVGIGTMDPAEKLEVKGKVKIGDTSQYILPNVAGANGQVLKIDENGVVSWQDPSSQSSSLWTEENSIISPKNADVLAMYYQDKKAVELKSDGLDSREKGMLSLYYNDKKE